MSCGLVLQNCLHISGLSMKMKHAYHMPRTLPSDMSEGKVPPREEAGGVTGAATIWCSFKIPIDPSPPRKLQPTTVAAALLPAEYSHEHLPFVMLETSRDNLRGILHGRSMMPHHLLEFNTLLNTGNTGLSSSSDMRYLRATLLFDIYRARSARTH